MTPDPLDRVAAPATDLLGRVDAALLAGGAPAGHPVWPLLRRVGALPGDAFAELLGLRPAALHACAAELRGHARSYLRVHAGLGAAQPWSGPAGRGYAARWAALHGHLGESVDPAEESLAGRLGATAAYLDELADWMRAARVGVARAVADALGSAQAVELRVGRASGGAGHGRAAAVPAGADGVAAAVIAAHVLGAVLRALEEGDAVARRHRDHLAELEFREPAGRAGDHHGESVEVTP